MRSLVQNPFPAPATLAGDQVLGGSCSETASLRLLTGNLNLSVQLVQIPTVGLPLGFHLFYNTQDDVLTPELGYRWRHQYQMRLKFDAYPAPAQVTLVGPDGGRQGFLSGPSGWTRDPGYHFTPASLVEGALPDEWRLEFPGGSRFVFQAVARDPVHEGRLVRLEDRHGNALSLTWNSSDQLEKITEPAGRSLELGYAPTTGALQTVTFAPTADPADRVVMRTFQVLDQELRTLAGPEGCLQQYLYDADHRLVNRMDPRLKELGFAYDGSDRLISATDAQGLAIHYAYDTVDEAMGDRGDAEHPTVVALDRTRLTDARGQTWEYRFDHAGNLWRTVDPLGRQVRSYWDGNQRLLYSSVGYPTHHDGSYTRQGPRDNLLNSVWRYAYDEAGNRTQAADPSGQVHSFTYDPEGRLLESVRGLAHLGVQGDWPGTYGEHGWLLCAFEPDGEDRQDLPDYVGAVSGDATDPFERLALADGLDLIDPRVPRDFATPERRLGFWRPVDEGPTDPGFSFRVQLRDPRDPQGPRDLLHEFNLSLYSHSADQAKGGYSPLTYPEQYGRGLRFTVSDVDETGAPRTRSFELFNNAAGVWTTFPVRGNLDGSADILVRVEASGADNTQARLSALAFDPPADRSQRFTWDAAGNLVAVRDGLGGVTGSSYNPDGTLDEVVDARNQSTRFVYDPANFQNLRQIVGPDLKVTSFDFDAFGLMASVQDANLHSTRFTYDRKGRLLTATTEGARVTTLDYDEAGNLLSVTDPQDRVTSFTYTAMNRLESVTDPEQGVSSFEWDGAGSLARVTDPRGQVTDLSYDAAGQLVRVRLSHEPEATCFDTVELAYDVQGRLVSLTSPGGTRPVGEVVPTGLRNLLTNPGAEEVDPFSPLATGARDWHRDLERVPGGRTGGFHLQQWGVPGYPAAHAPTRIVPGVPLLAQGYVALSDPAITYAAALRLSQYSLTGEAFTAEQEVLARQAGYAPGWRRVGPVRFQPDGRNQRPEVAFGLKSEAATGSVSSVVGWDDLELLALGTGYRHDASGRLAEVVLPDGGRQRLRYDRFGNLAESEDAQGRVTRFRHDALDRLVEVADPEGHAHRFAYDAVGQLVSFTEPGPGDPTTSYSYDAMGRLATLTYPDGTTEAFSYDAAGRLATCTDNRGRSFAFAHDGDDRLGTLTAPDATTVDFTYQDSGSLASRRERNGDRTIFTRDDLDRVTREVFTPGPGSASPAWTHEHGYDAASHRTRLVSGSSAAARYGAARLGQDRCGREPVLRWEVPAGGYDARGRLVRFRDGDAHETTMTYDGEGRRTSITYPNGVVTTAEYDFLGRLLSLSTAQGSTRLLDLAYAYDANSNRRAMVSGGDRFDYRLDRADRLVQETLNCWSRRTREDFRLLQGAGLDTVGQPDKVQALGFDDPLAGPTLDLDRWRLASSNLEVRGLHVQADQGLSFTFPRGFSHRVFAHPPDFWGDRAMAGADLYGLSRGLFWAGAEHRLPLEGDFELTVDFDRLQKTLDLAEPARLLRVGLLVRDAPLEQPAANSVGVFRAEDATREGWQSELRAGGGPPTEVWSTADPTAAGSLRIRRADGLVTTSFREAGAGNWTDLHVAQAFEPGTPLRVSLCLQVASALGTARFRDFARTLGAVHPFPESNPAFLTSEVFDVGRSGVAGARISWSESLPPGCDVKLRVAARDTDPDGTWADSEFRGPDGTAATFYSTPAGEDLHPSLVGRYFRYRVDLVTSPTATPDLTELLLTFAGDHPWYDRRYTYDARGNMTGKQVRTASGTTTETRTVNELNQIVTNSIDDGTTVATWLYTWDLNGNLATRSDGTEAWTYTFADDNRLTRVQKAVSGLLQLDVSYTYDSLGRMLTRKLSTDANPTTFEWDGWDLLREVDPAGVETVYYAPQSEFLSFKRGASLYQLHCDAIRNACCVTDASGSVVASRSTDAWGQAFATSGSAVLGNLGFVGGLGVISDAATGLLMMRLRWYDPELGSFIARDTLRARNRYSYGRNNPTTFIDPTGLDAQLTPEQMQSFNDALGILVNLGGQYQTAATTLRDLDRQGKINAGDPAQFTGREAGTLAYTDPPVAGSGKKIHLNADLLFAGMVAPGRRDRRPGFRQCEDRSRRAVTLAATLYHELYHYQNRDWTQLRAANYEVPAYTAEREFFRDFMSAIANKNALVASLAARRYYALAYIGAQTRESEMLQPGAYLEGQAAIFTQNMPFPGPPLDPNSCECMGGGIVIGLGASSLRGIAAVAISIVAVGVWMGVLSRPEQPEHSEGCLSIVLPRLASAPEAYSEDHEGVYPSVPSHTFLSLWRPSR